MTLMDALRHAVAERHARIEQLPFVTALRDGMLPLQSYAAHLGAWSIVHEAFDRQLPKLPYREIVGLHHAYPSRTTQVLQDLAALAPFVLPDIPEARAEAAGIAREIARLGHDDPEALLAIVYVLWGTTLGNTVHVPDIRRCYGKAAADFSSYYEGFGKDTGAAWLAFSRAMNAIPTTPDRIERLSNVGNDLFDRLERTLACLFPLRRSTAESDAQSLNPDAGHHPVTDDPIELEAAESAARRCRDEFPYIDELYPQRAGHFAMSDTAWLLTLVDLPPAFLLQQVRWLGQVLSNRGMPTIVLERQIALLLEALATCAPERATRHSPLLDGSRALAADRLSRIPEPTFTTIVEKFKRATDDEMRGRYRNTGLVIVAAVCDEASGMPKAVSSLVPWLSDATRFGPQWIAAVVDAHDRARGALVR